MKWSFSQVVKSSGKKKKDIHKCDFGTCSTLLHYIFSAVMQGGVKTVRLNSDPKTVNSRSCKSPSLWDQLCSACHGCSVLFGSWRSEMITDQQPLEERVLNVEVPFDCEQTNMRLVWLYSDLTIQRQTSFQLLSPLFFKVILSWQYVPESRD